MIASAVVIPDAPSPSRSRSPRNDSPSPVPVPQKRRHPSSPPSRTSRSPSSKRARLSPSPPTAAPPPRPRPAPADERKRNQRLFGALLGTLSQSSGTSSAQKRRDIERRQQAKIRAQAAEDDEAVRRRAGEVRAERVREQRVYDGLVMRTRHGNMLAMANFLRTSTEPQLYFRPWDLRADEEERIKRQVEDAQAEVDRELSDYRYEEDKYREQEGGDDEVMGNTTAGQQQEQEASPGDSAKPVVVKEEEEVKDEALAANAPASDAEQDSQPAEEHDHDRDMGDDNNEEVLEAEEDTVLY